MKLLKFTDKLLQFLRDKGVRYCYSRTITNDNEPGKIDIILTPCFKKPNVRRLPKSFDTFFSINRELLQMVRCIDDDMHVYIDLSAQK